MSTHHGFIKEFPFIRCDAFDGEAVDVNPYSDDAPHFYLLTHAHTDHLTGLSSPQFHGEIYCTPITKHILLNTMEAGERVRYEETSAGERKEVRKFANLRAKKTSRGSGDRARASMDCIREIKINEPRILDGPEGQVKVTALDANHCPGSCMFLIEGSYDSRRCAVLITGDIRAETWWIDALERNPIVARYVVPARKYSDTKEKGKLREDDRHRVWEGLECIYLDTSLVLLDVAFPSKKQAIEDALDLMALYPNDTKFFLNCWTWGYEELLKGVAQSFDTHVHLDWYKGRLFSHPTMASYDSLLAALATDKPTSSRFHACERRWKCDEVWCDGLGCYVFDEEDMEALKGGKKFKRPGRGEDRGAGNVIYVNPVSMGEEKWREYKERLAELAMRSKSGQVKGGGGLPNHLILPLARHSPLPELQRFIGLFKPKTIYPLTIIDDPSAPGRDYRSLPRLFETHLATGGVERLSKEANEYTLSMSRRRRATKEVMEEETEVFTGATSAAMLALNVEGGEGVAKFVEEWVKVDECEILPPTPQRMKKRVRGASGTR